MENIRRLKLNSKHDISIHPEVRRHIKLGTVFVFIKMTKAGLYYIFDEISKDYFSVKKINVEWLK